MTNEKDDGGGREEEPGGQAKLDASKPLEPSTKIKWHYSGEELWDLRNSPASKKKPSCLLDEFCDDKGVWEPELWHLSFSGRRSRGPSPLTLYENKDLIRKKYPADPKERLLEEKDGIVLSPQRRSFGLGCQMAFQSSGASIDRSHNHSPVEGKDHELPVRTIPSRRTIGSGRIITRNRPQAENSEREIFRDRDRDRELDRDRDRGERDRDGQREWTRSRDLDRNWEMDRDRDRDRDFRDNRDRGGNRQGYNRYGYNRHGYRRQEEAPEWFTGGPTSQHDTITLHGFNDPEEDSGSEPDVKGRSLKKFFWTKITLNGCNDPIDRGNKTDIKERRPSVADRNGSMETASSSSPEVSNESANNHSSGAIQNKEFDLNDFFKLETMLPTTDEGETVMGKSRFSHLFSSQRVRTDSSGTSRSNSRRSSPHDPEMEFYTAGIEQLMGRPSPTMGMGDRHFTPITPAEGAQVPNTAAKMAILGMIQKNNQNQQQQQQQQQHQQQQQQQLHQLQQQIGGEPAGSQSISQPRPQKNEDEAYRKTVVKQKLMAGQAKSLAEIEADMKKTTLTDETRDSASPQRSQPSGSAPSTANASPAKGAGEGGLPPQLIAAAQHQGMGGSSSKGDQSAFNSFIASMKATGSLSQAEQREPKTSSPKRAHPNLHVNTPSPPSAISNNNQQQQQSMDKAAMMMNLKAAEQQALRQQHQQQMAQQQQQQQQQHHVPQGGRGVSPLPPGLAPMVKQPILNLPDNRGPSPVNQEVMAALFKNHTPPPTTTGAGAAPQHPLSVPQPGQPGPSLQRAGPGGGGGPPASAEQIQALWRQNPEQMMAVVRQFQLQQQQQQQLARQRASPIPPNQEVVLAILQHAMTNPTFAAALMAQANKEAQLTPGAAGQINRAASPRDMLTQALLQSASIPRMQSPVALQGHQSPLPTSPAALRSQSHSPLPGAMAPPALGPGGLAPSPLLGAPASGNTLAPPGASQANPALMPQRIPSPQELAKHTQSILQQALIRKQLEVQKEKFKAKEAARAKSPAVLPANQVANQQQPQQKPGQQQPLQPGGDSRQQQQQQQPVAGQQSQVQPTPQQARQKSGSFSGTPPGTPSHKASSKIITAFTPTSVIRKMHESKAEAKAATHSTSKPGDGGKGDAPLAQEGALEHQEKAPELRDEKPNITNVMNRRQSEGDGSHTAIIPPRPVPIPQRGPAPPPGLAHEPPHSQHHHPPPPSHQQLPPSSQHHQNQQHPQKQQNQVPNGPSKTEMQQSHQQPLPPPPQQGPHATKPVGQENHSQPQLQHLQQQQPHNQHLQQQQQQHNFMQGKQQNHHIPPPGMGGPQRPEVAAPRVGERAAGKPPTPPNVPHGHPQHHGFPVNRGIGVAQPQQQTPMIQQQQQQQQQQQARMPMNPAMMLPPAMQASLMRGMMVSGMVPPGMRGVPPPPFSQVPLQNLNRGMAPPNLQHMMMSAQAQAQAQAQQHQGNAGPRPMQHGGPVNPVQQQSEMYQQQHQHRQGGHPQDKHQATLPPQQQHQQQQQQQQQAPRPHPHQQHQHPPPHSNPHHPHMGPFHPGQQQAQHPQFAQHPLQQVAGLQQKQPQQQGGGGGGGGIGMDHRRASPVNHLAKWFSQDLLKNPMGKMPPVPSGQKILSVEELERQQQQQQVVG